MVKEKINTILETLDIIKDRYNEEFYFMIGKGGEAALRGRLLNPDGSIGAYIICIGIEWIDKYDKDILKSIVIHESFHRIFDDLNQSQISSPWETNIEYYESEIKTWERVKEKFSELEEVCNEMIRIDKQIIESLNARN